MEDVICKLRVEGRKRISLLKWVSRQGKEVGLGFEIKCSSLNSDFKGEWLKLRLNK